MQKPDLLKKFKFTEALLNQADKIFLTRNFCFLALFSGIGRSFIYLLP
jgi:hypothetical protein